MLAPAAWAWKNTCLVIDVARLWWHYSVFTLKSLWRWWARQAGVSEHNYNQCQKGGREGCHGSQQLMPCQWKTSCKWTEMSMVLQTSYLRVTTNTTCSPFCLLLHSPGPSPLCRVAVREPASFLQSHLRHGWRVQILHCPACLIAVAARRCYEAKKFTLTRIMN